jgi:hypothetical protein
MWQWMVLSRSLRFFREGRDSRKSQDVAADSHEWRSHIFFVEKRKNY